MTLDYWWAHRNNRRNCRLPDLNAPFDPDTALPGTPSMRFAACVYHVNKQLVLARARAKQKRAWRIAQGED